MKGRHKSAVFLDRDGTLIEDVGYLTRLAEVKLLPGAPEALRRLRSAGFLLIVVTNQSAVARGLLTEHRLQRIHQSIQEALREHGAEVDDFFYCPHLPDADVQRYNRNCTCRKPEPGMLLEAARKWNIDLRRSYTVGDSERDMEAGKRAGCRTILLAAEQSPSAAGEATARTLAEAAELITGWSDGA